VHEFPYEPLEFWKTAITTLGGDTDFFLSLSKDFTLSYTDGTISNFGPLLSGMTFKLISASTVGTEYQLKYEIVDLKTVSNDGSLEIEMDTSVSRKYITAQYSTDALVPLPTLSDSPIG